MSMLKINPALKSVREAAGASQKDLAAALRVDQSRVSRIENGSVEPTPDEIEKWLAFCPGLEADRLGAFLLTPWPQDLRPNWDHPDLNALALAVETIARIDAAMPELGTILQSQLALYRLGLQQHAGFLVRRDHRVAFIGPVAVGKTTIMAQATALVLGKSGSPPTYKDTILPTGAGRTTVCEFAVEEGDSWGLIIEPESAESIKFYVDDLCAHLLGVRDLPTDEDKGTRERVPQEVARALKNMADFTTWGPKGTEGGLAGSELNIEEFQNDFFVRLRLPERRTTELWWSEQATPSPLAWLRSTLQKVNNGNHESVSLPKKIRIQVGRPLLDEQFKLTLLDTRGVDQSVARPDLAACFNDPRTATILCSTFLGAPDLYTTQLLNFADETGITGLSDRSAILVLAKSLDALDVRREIDGEPVSDSEEGYAVKAAQVELAMRNVEPAKIALDFFNASSDSVDRLRSFLKERVNATRNPARRRVNELVAATAEILDNPDEAAVRAAQAEVAAFLSTALQTEEKVGPEAEPVHQRLVAQISATHPRTVWAMVRRSGDWHNLNAQFFLGASGAADAKQRTKEAAGHLHGVAKTLHAKPEFEPAKRLIDELENATEEARSQLVTEVKNLAEGNYGPAIKADHALWAACRAHWGHGKGFRDKVAGEVEKWFKDPQRAALHTTYDKGYQKAWSTKFIGALMKRVLGEA